MPLTPEDVSNKRFSPVRLREGYDMAEVDAFLDEVETELVRLIADNDELRAQLTSTEPGTPAPAAAQPDTPPAPVTQDASDTGPDTGPALPATAETIRVETLPQASQAAARLLEIAARNADELVTDATGAADRILGDARTEADRMTAEAKAGADRVESEARQRSEHLDQETADRRRQLFEDLERERDRLGNDVDTLRAFEREYRSRLRTYFAEQLAALEQAEDSDTAAPQASVPGPSDPGPADPGPADPGPSDPGPSDPGPSGPVEPTPDPGPGDGAQPADGTHRLRSLLGDDGP